MVKAAENVPMILKYSNQFTDILKHISFMWNTV